VKTAGRSILTAFAASTITSSGWTSGESLTMHPPSADLRRPDPRWSRYSRRFIEWMISGRRPQPHHIQIELLRHSLNKKNTLIVLTFAMMLVAFVAVVVTGEVWAYAWLLAEPLLGYAKLGFQTKFERENASGKAGDAAAPIFAGLAGGIVLGVAGYECVASGNWFLMLLSGICLGGMVGGIGSRNAGVPRFAIILMCLVALPYSFACLISPVPYLFVIGLQMPLFLGGLFLVLYEDYNVLLGLYHAQSENRWQANHDMLTGLPNRIMQQMRFAELLRERISQSPEQPPPLTVFCLDLDGFKDVNDRFGHAAGDTILVAVVGRLRDCIRDVDFLCRIGGDEFVILLPAIPPAEAAAVAQRIIARVSEPFEIDGVPVRIGMSVGSACAPDDGETAEELLRAADRAMYAAKRRGKGLFVAHTGGIREFVELAPAADADAKMSHPASERPDAEISRFPLPFRSKSL
jgi:diguanylate cyclase